MNQSESNNLLPSGNWEGFYCYSSDTHKHKMEIELHFKSGKITGTGVDDVGAFHWSGSYDLVSFKATMVKHYTSHTVNYIGTIDENGIWGIWEIKQSYLSISGGFHIWPKKQEEGKIAVSVEEEVLVVESNSFQDIR